MPELTAVARSAPAGLHRVLVLGGGAPPARLLELARASAPRGSTLEISTIDAARGEPLIGAEALAGLQPDTALPPVRTVLEALHGMHADALVVAYPQDARGRSEFSDIVERATAAASIDVHVCVNRHDRPWRRVLVPYLCDSLDRGALNVARRLARREDAEVTVLYVEEPQSPDETDPQLRGTIGGCTLKVVTAGDPIAAAAEEARLGYDLIILGSSERRTRGRYFSMRQQRLLLAADASLVIVHAGRQPD